ncbi:phosphatidylinositol 5-phosphate 4-kinase isoform a [Anaeramoeba flamelloides]|uniref:Phosphatidylinositol 5-phosphate 4-kinase isoform a n=1 Tax=Anaeramoeba flamelloides TaxID=1746091 RepID=A0AAV8A215_9EUKA|nr:phosphatidylinositol 5-phosphate 4-kinase isoform a [Anaeramoeba flamelloides]
MEGLNEDSLQNLFNFSLEAISQILPKNNPKNNQANDLETIRTEHLDAVYSNIQILTDSILSNPFQESLQKKKIASNINKCLQDLPTMGKIFDSQGNQTLQKKQDPNQIFQSLGSQIKPHPRSQPHKKQQAQEKEKEKEKKKEKQKPKKHQYQLHNKKTDYNLLSKVYKQKTSRILSEINYIQDVVEEGIESWSKDYQKNHQLNKLVPFEENKKKKKQKINLNTSLKSLTPKRIPKDLKDLKMKFVSKQNPKSKKSSQQNNNIKKQNNPQTEKPTQQTEKDEEKSTVEESNVLKALQHYIKIHNYSKVDEWEQEKIKVKDEHFNEVKKIELYSHGNKIKKSKNKKQVKSQPTFVIQEYSPKAFYHLRIHYDISPLIFEESICDEKKGLEGMIQDGGRSGATFFVSKNKKFVVKLIEKSESLLLTQILKKLYTYILQNPNNLLTQFYGHYSISTITDNYFFIVMNNVFSTDYKINEVYDLKGSTINRGGDRRKKNLKILKDNDLNDKLYLSKNLRNKLIDQISSDTKFLKSLNIMDYSLLLGVHHCTEREIQHEKEENEKSNKKKNSLIIPFQKISDFKRHNGGVRSLLDDKKNPKQCIYFLGIIDCLQLYNVKKKVEHGFKIVKHLTTTEMSAVDSKLYAKRFLDLIRNITSDPSEEL